MPPPPPAPRRTDPGVLACRLASRAVVRFRGPEAARFLNSLLTNDLLSHSPSSEPARYAPTPNVPARAPRPVYNALLTPQGRFLVVGAGTIGGDSTAWREAAAALHAMTGKGIEKRMKWNVGLGRDKATHLLTSPDAGELSPAGRHPPRLVHRRPPARAAPASSGPPRPPSSCSWPAPVLLRPAQLRSPASHLRPAPARAAPAAGAWSSWPAPPAPGPLGPPRLPGEHAAVPI
ncbi:hypothetical protein QYE76_052619 [Lolium multiflorum]|uniref:Uncharacterized protein n=1 Tax=Lolium multiflorum TaxID=4521 RepID=A0AAD8SV25_LOLMU|nr:hypothetical protein QYE76_052619 [Lolium multiflorum]